MNEAQAKIAQLQDMNWTLAAIADELGVTVNAVEKWKAGDRYPTNVKPILETLDRLTRRKSVPKQRRYTKDSRREEEAHR